jgi:hypothetical protein
VGNEMTEEVGIFYGSCQPVLTKDLGMSFVSGRFIPGLLTWQQNENHFSVASDVLECAETDENFLKLKCIITGDETLVCGYDPIPVT